MVASNSRIMSRRIEGVVFKVCVCVCRVLSGRRTSRGAAPALDDPSESLVVAEGPAKDELEMGAVLAISAVSTPATSVQQRTLVDPSSTAPPNASAIY